MDGLHPSCISKTHWIPNPREHATSQQSLIVASVRLDFTILRAETRLSRLLPVFLLFTSFQASVPPRAHDTVVLLSFFCLRCVSFAGTCGARPWRNRRGDDGVGDLEPHGRRVFAGGAVLLRRFYYGRCESNFILLLNVLCYCSKHVILTSKYSSIALIISLVYSVDCVQVRQDDNTL